MLSAPIPPCESQRLKELYSYEVFDTATDKALDDIAQSATTICGTTFGAGFGGLMCWKTRWR